MPFIELIEKVHGIAAVQDSVTLPFAARQRSRQRVVLDSGTAAGIVLEPGTALDHGDLLRAADGTAVRVQAAAEAVMTARTADPLRLARACYHLGNRHVALQVGPGWVRFQPDHVLEEMLAGLGLSVVQESVVFEPERGAYGGHGHGHGHGRHHEHERGDGGRARPQLAPDHNQ
ncbi:MAG: urease accessory protein UreE [Gammaproteobacteria bacterium]